MRYISLGLLLLLAGCGDTQRLHVADLPASSADPYTISYLSDGYDFESSEPTHNQLPAHSPERVISNRVVHFDGNCQELAGKKICYSTELLNSRLVLTVTEGNKSARLVPYAATFERFLYSALGGPPQIYDLVNYDKDTLGILHTGGFSVYHRGKFCISFEKNPNGILRFGLDSSGTLLFASSGPVRDGLADRAVEGWRRYDLAQMCAN